MSKATGFPWITRTQAAKLASLSGRQFDDVIKDRIAVNGRQGTGAKLRYSAPEVVEAVVAYRIDQLPKPVSEDPLMNMPGGQIEYIDEYRKWKAGRERIKFLEEHGESITISEIEPALGQFASDIRRTGDFLQKKYGPEAADILNKGVDDAVAGVAEFFAKVRAKSDTAIDGTVGEAVQDTTASDNEGIR